MTDGYFVLFGGGPSSKIKIFIGRSHDRFHEGSSLGEASNKEMQHLSIFFLLLQAVAACGYSFLSSSLCSRPLEAVAVLAGAVADQIQFGYCSSMSYLLRLCQTAVSGCVLWSLQLQRKTRGFDPLLIQPR